jgi:hypothetical protein
MSFREINHRWIVPGAQALMIFGIIALCQPWWEPLHHYGLTIIIVGLLGFMIATKIPAPARRDEDAA